MNAMPLADLRVLDLSRGGGARACANLLALLGADVQSHDPLTHSRAPAPTSRYEVVISDLQPAEAAALCLTPADLGEDAADVVVSVTPFGLDGPDADRPADGSLLDAVGGQLMAALAGAHAAVAALAAIRWARYRRSRVCVEVAALEVAATCLGERLPRSICPREGTAGRAGAGADRHLTVLPCADGYVGIATPTVVDRDHLAGLTDVVGVRAETADLDVLLRHWLRARTRAEVFHAAQLWRLPVVPVLEPAEVVEDEQSLARGVWAEAPGRGLVARSPFRFSATGGVVGRQSQPRLQPLSDTLVLDLGMVWAGPYCGRLLAGLGARVVKIEGPTRPDGTRPDNPTGCAGVFGDLNRSKSSLVVDLVNPLGRDVLLRLAARADVVIESFSPRVMPNFGLDYPVLAAANPGLVMLSMPAFGSDGPWAGYVAYGSGLELATGLAALGSDGRPMPAPVAYLDYLAGVYSAAGVLAALLARDRSGQGAHLEVAQREVACQLLNPRSALRRKPVLTLDPQAVAVDPHLAARGLFGAPARAGLLCSHYARLPWRLHGVPSRLERLAPAFGADSRHVLRSVADLPTEEIERLIGAGIVGAPARSSRRSR